MKPQPRQSAAEEAHASQKDDIFSGLSPASMEDCLAFLGDEVGSLVVALVWPKSVDYLDGLPDPLTFYRDYVAVGRPCVIRGAFDDWPALSKWSSDYLEDICGSAPISVDVTPMGHGDCLHRLDGVHYFVQPEQRKTTLGAALEHISRLQRNIKREIAEDEGIFYVQKQNDSFRQEYEPLWNDIKDNVEKWGNQVFGLPADAVNWWCGPDEAVSAMHKDPYENLYCVVKGTKIFTLLPQSALPFLSTTFGVPAHFVHETTRKVDPERSLSFYEHTKWKVEVDQQEIHEDEDGNKLPPYEVPWIAVDVTDPESIAEHPRAQQLQPQPLQVKVRAGEMLFLPSLVFHTVAQSCGQDEYTVAVNYWFDMRHDIRYCYLQLLEKMFPPLPSSEKL